MKILFVSDIFYPHTGGVPEHILYLCNNLRSMGHDAKILAPSYGDNEPWTDDYVIRLGRAIKIPKNRSFAVMTFGILIPWKLRRLLEKEGFDPDPAIPCIEIFESDEFHHISFGA
jgi:hypothetical protein